MNEWSNLTLDTSSLDNLDFRLTKERIEVLPPDKLDWLRRLCQTNLRFLTNCVLRPARRFPSLLERVHGPIIDSFMRPDPDKPFDQWSTKKERVTLAFRGALKSTMVGGFLVQVQLCDPDIRVLILSGKLNKAESILASGCNPFATNDVLRFLFPDWAVDYENLSSKEFISPKRDMSLNLRDPTLDIATFDSVKAGGHYELAIFDDCTNEINCATPELVEKNEQHYDDTFELIEPGGYRHLFATRWAPDDSDLPEVIKRRGEAFAEENEGESGTVYFRLPVWTLREDGAAEEQLARVERDKRNTLRPTDVILTWPEKLNSKFLWPKYRANPIRFNRQYLLRYKGSLTVEAFTHDLLMSNTRPFHDGIPLPHDRFTVVNWDLSGVWSGRRGKNASDFTCGIAATFELSTRRLFSYDAIMEVYDSSTDVATAIVDFYAQQLRIGPVDVCSIEDKHGARFLQGEIAEIARKKHIPLTITWNIPDCVADIKNAMIIKLAGAMKRGLVQFSTTIPQRDDIFKQFEKWAPQHKRVKDDAPDCLSQIWWHYSEQIFPNMIKNMQPSGLVFDPEPMAEEPIDPHRDEKENADMALLQGMTVAHA